MRTVKRSVTQIKVDDEIVTPASGEHMTVLAKQSCQSNGRDAIAFAVRGADGTHHVRIWSREWDLDVVVHVPRCSKPGCAIDAGYRMDTLSRTFSDATRCDRHAAELVAHGTHNAIRIED